MRGGERIISFAKQQVRLINTLMRPGARILKQAPRWWRQYHRRLVFYDCIYIKDTVPEAFTMLNGGGNESHCRRH